MRVQTLLGMSQGLFEVGRLEMGDGCILLISMGAKKLNILEPNHEYRSHSC